MRALVIGTINESTILIPDLIFRAGFEVDCIANTQRLKKHRSINNFFYEKNIRNTPQVAAQIIGNKIYDIVIPTDDNIIKIILDSEINPADKLRLLPVVKLENCTHLSSKIGLSKALKENSILTPEFRVVNNKNDLTVNAAELGFPLIVKGDFSGGGNQTFKCLDNKDLHKILRSFNFFPAILQSFVIGDLISIEAFYQNAELIQFAYSKVIKFEENNQFASSSVREYVQIGALNAEIGKQISNLGIALGADGFANITCIHSHIDQRHYFIEADMRPNAWVNHPKYFGDDPAKKIMQYFASGAVPDKITIIDNRYPIQIVMPYLPRLKTWEIICNRYSSWRYLTEDFCAFKLIFRKVKHSLLAILNLRAIRKLVNKWIQIWRENHS